MFHGHGLAMRNVEHMLVRIYDGLLSSGRIERMMCSYDILNFKSQEKLYVTFLEVTVPRR